MADKVELRDRIERAVAMAYNDARSYAEEVLAEERAESTRYYNGEPFGDEEEGRSQVVSRDVLDTVKSYMPSIMRVLIGGERPVEYEPQGPEDIAGAEQATDFIADVVLRQDNEGFTQVHAAVKDALVRKLGIWKWWWDDRKRRETVTQTGLSEGAVLLLQDDDSVESIEVTRTTDEGIEPKLFDVTITRVFKDGRARFAAVPPEEFLISRRARSVREADFVAHRATVTVSDLVAMGYDAEELTAVAEIGPSELDGTAEALARNPYAATMGNGGEVDASMRRVLYIEAWIRMQLSDEDEDPAELVRVCGFGGGKSFHLLDYAPTDEIPFAVFSPDPEPHTIFGLCPADDVKDIQRIKSAILRQSLDALALSVHPRYEAVEGAVNLQDLMNSEVGGVVRVRQPGMLREIALPGVLDKTIPMLDYFDRVKESRTKQNSASQGLDADALQSSTKAAVSATISAAQAQIELTTRIIAETGFKRLFEGLFKLICDHPDQKRTVRLRNKWVEVDPRTWNRLMDVRVNVALGAGSNEEKLATLAGIAAKQELILASAPGNPMVSMAELRHTYAKMTELAGWKDASLFFKEVPQDYQPPAPAGSDAGDAQMLAQVQMADIQAKVQMKQMELQAEAERARAADATERHRIAVDAQVKLTIAEAQHGAKIDEMKFEAAIRKMEAQQEAATRTREAELAADAAKESAKEAAKRPRGEK